MSDDSDVEKPRSLGGTHIQDGLAVGPQLQADEVPEGGLESWLTVLGGWIVLFTTFGYTNSFGVYQALYTLSGTSSASNISWIGSLQLFFMFVIGLPAGRLFDQGYFRYTHAAGSILFIFCIFMLSLADPSKYWQLVLAQGVGMGIGQGLLLVPAYAIQTHHWRRKRSTIMGIVSTGTSIGGIVYPIVLNQLFKGSAGFAWGVRATAFLSMGLLFASNFIMTPRPPRGKGGFDAVDQKANLMKALRDVPFMTLVFSSILIYIGLFFPYFYLQLFVNTHGNFSSEFAFYTIAMLNAGSIPGRVIPNLLAQKYGHVNAITTVAVVCGILNFAMFGLKSVGAVVVFSLLYGFFSGGYISLISPTTATFAESVDEFGIRLGIGSFVCSFALLAGSPIVGALLNLGLHWWRPILFGGITISSSLVGLLAARYGMAVLKGTPFV